MADILRIGHYLVNRSVSTRLGKGQFGEVWRGRNTTSNEECAVKEITKPENEFKYIDQELAILKETSHPNITELYHSEWKGNVLYMFMEFCEDGDLDKYVETNKEFSEDVLLSFMQGCADAINYLHNRNPPVVHRDLKPGNILVKTVNHIPTVKITDLGFSCFVTKDFSTVCGTPYYMAPEVMPDKDGNVKYNLPADIFSLGLVFHSMVTHKSGQKLTPIKGTVA